MSHGVLVIHLKIIINTLYFHRILKSDFTGRDLIFKTVWRFSYYVCNHFKSFNFFSYQLNEIFRKCLLAIQIQP